MEASEAPMTPEMYQKSANVEKEYEADFEKDFPLSKSFPQRVCPTSRLILLLMVFCGILILSVSILGIQGRSYSATLRKMKEDLKTSNRTLAVELADLERNETDNLKSFQKVNQMVENLTKETTEVKSQYLDQIQKLQETLQKANCDLENTKHKGKGPASGCCPRGWHLFQQSCYWLSSAQNSWTEAKEDCEEKTAHLVVLSGDSERQFVVRLAKPYTVWIGLKYRNGVWTWADGTPHITVHWLDWKPDRRMHSNLFCTSMEQDGLWHDDFCRVRLKWVCEMLAQQ